MPTCIKFFQIYYLSSKTNQKNVENEDNERKGYFLTYPAFQGDHCIMHSNQICHFENLSIKENVKLNLTKKHESSILPKQDIFHQIEAGFTLA